MHFRYILPALPFALVGLSKVAELRSRWCAGAVALLVGSSVISSVAVYPHSLAYFNEAAGGPANGEAHLIDSNLDWGQDLTRLKKWFDDHPDTRPLYLTYTNFVDYRVSGLPQLPPMPVTPDQLTPGFYAADIQSLYEGGLGYLRPLTPVARVGYSIRVYRLDEADIARIRAAHPSP
jgi:hypothetical protein